MSARPLFIPLKGKHYDAFESGEKTVEMRQIGPRWNLMACPPGREVLLSRGYGKARRLRGVIVAAGYAFGPKLNATARAELRDCYGTDRFDVFFMEIRIRKEEAA